MASVALNSNAHSNTSSLSLLSVMMVLLPGSPAEEEVEGRGLAEEAEDSEGTGALVDRRLPSVFTVTGGAAMFLGSNLDLFWADLAAEVEGLFLDS